MKPHDKSNSFMGRITKRVSKYLPRMTWMNTLISDAQIDDDPTSTTENDYQPTLKKLCTSNNSFTNTKYQSTHSTDNHSSSNVNILLPEISAVTCIPSTSKQSPTFTSLSSASLQSHDVGNKSLKRSLNLEKLPTSNECLTPTSSKLIKPRENESFQQSSLKFHDTSANYGLPASFKWDTFFNYGELSERKRFLQVDSNTRKLRVNLSRGRGTKAELEMPAGINLPRISLPLNNLPNINLSNTYAEDKEFKFIQPLTVEEFSSKLAEKMSRKTPLLCSTSKLEFTKPANTNVDSSPKKLESKNQNQLAPEKSSTKLKKLSCVTCWFPNAANEVKCIACQTPKSKKSQTPTFKVNHSSTGTSATCWFPNINEFDVCVTCKSQKPGTTKTVVQSNSWTCNGCWVKNKSDCTTCISCGTTKPGSVPENKPLPSTQFKFGLNNTFENSGASQFKFGFDNKIDQPSNNQFEFGSAGPFTSSDSKKLDAFPSTFKFGKPGLIKNFQLSSFGSLAKQDQNVRVDQKSPKMFTFGSATNKMLFSSSMMGASSFPTTTLVFGASSSMFGSGPTISTPVTLGSSILTPQFSFGSLAPQIPNSFFSQTTNVNDKKPLAQTSNLFSSSNNVEFSFGAQSPPVFSVPNAGGPIKISSTDVDQTICTSNNTFSQPSTK